MLALLLPLYVYLFIFISTALHTNALSHSSTYFSHLPNHFLSPHTEKRPRFDLLRGTIKVAHHKITVSAFIPAAVFPPTIQHLEWKWGNAEPFTSRWLLSTRMEPIANFQQCFFHFKWLPSHLFKLQSQRNETNEVAFLYSSPRQTRTIHAAHHTEHQPTARKIQSITMEMEWQYLCIVLVTPLL